MDDVLTGASTVSQAMQILFELCVQIEVLQKFHRNSAEVYVSIPEHLSESKGLSISTEPHLESEALGVHWDVGNDNF